MLSKNVVAGIIGKVNIIDNCFFQKRNFYKKFLKIIDR